LRDQFKAAWASRRSYRPPLVWAACAKVDITVRQSYLCHCIFFGSPSLECKKFRASALSLPRATRFTLSASFASQEGKNTKKKSFSLTLTRSGQIASELSKVSVSASPPVVDAAFLLNCGDAETLTNYAQTREPVLHPATPDFCLARLAIGGFNDQRSGFAHCCNCRC
jgi:hypothetical protein